MSKKHDKSSLSERDLNSATDKMKDGSTINAMSDPAPEVKSRSSAWTGVIYVTQMGFTIAATVFVGVLLGRLIDRFLGTSPWFLLLFSLLGVGASIVGVYKSFQNK